MTCWICPIEAGELELEATPVDLRKSISDIMRLNAAVAMEHDVELAVQFMPDTPSCIISDPTRIRQIILNLISNAIKFSDGGYVCVHIDVEEQRGEDITYRIR